MSRRKGNGMTRAFGFVLLTLAVCLMVVLSSGKAQGQADDSELQIYLLAGQSNMVGQAYTWEFNATGPGGWNVPTMEYLRDSPSYIDALPDDVYSFKDHFNADWFKQRDDVWAAHYNPGNGRNIEVRNEPDSSPNDGALPDYPRGIQPLSPGFGPAKSFGGHNASLIGPELAMGQRLGDAMTSEVLLFKSNRGGTDLANDWRPPSAAADRGGSVGGDYKTTVHNFKQLLDDLDADLADNGRLDQYGGATDYQVAGFVWMQGWNTVVGGGSSARIAEYSENLQDLVEDLRAADERIADDLPAVIVESSDQNADLNSQRKSAVDVLNETIENSAVFIETNGLKDVNYADRGAVNSKGDPFSNGWGYHYHARAENFLEIGNLIGESVLKHRYLGSETP
jgi:hypothetical protein